MALFKVTFGNITLSEFLLPAAGQALLRTEYHENDFSARQQFDVGRMTTQVAHSVKDKKNAKSLPPNSFYPAAGTPL